MLSRKKMKARRNSYGVPLIITNAGRYGLILFRMSLEKGVLKKTKSIFCLKATYICINI